MRTYAAQMFYHGFKLTEQELRRILGLAVQQIEKTKPTAEVRVSIQTWFKNGASSLSGSVDEILALENAGSAAITGLTISVDDGQKSPRADNQEENLTIVTVQFFDTEALLIAASMGTHSVAYSIVGEDRDWVFITKSLLEERIAKIKTFSPMEYLRGRVRPIVAAFIAFAFFFLLGFATMVIYSRIAPSPVRVQYEAQWAEYSSAFDIALEQDRQVKLKALDDLETAWRSSPISDTVVVLFGIQRVLLQPSTTSKLKPPERLKPADLVVEAIPQLLVGFAMPLAICMLFLVWSYANRPFNFLWSDYV